MKRGWIVGIVIALVVLGVGAGYAGSLFGAEERTRVELDLLDARDEQVERAVVAFENASGDVIAAADHAHRRWVFADSDPANEGWGEGVASVHVRAFECDRQAPVEIEKETHGSRFGRLAPHPVPLTHVYVIRGEVRCPDPGTSNETGLELASIVDDLSRGEPWSVAAGYELIRLGPAGAAALANLIARFDETPERGLRVSLARAFGGMGSAASSAVPALTRMLEDEEASHRRVAATALEGIGPGAPGVVSALGAAARRDSDRHTQEHVLRILGRMGPEARSAESELVAILEDEAEEDPVRRAAFSALGHLRTSSATEAQRRYAATHPILWSQGNAGSGSR